MSAPVARVLAGDVLQAILDGRERVDALDVWQHRDEVSSLSPSERRRLRGDLAGHMGVEDFAAVAETLGITDSDAPAGDEPVRAVAVPLGSIERREIDWLWRGWLARGSVVTLAGPPGVGKSYLLAAIAAAITLGAPLPGDTARREPASVLMVAAEDDEAAVLRPRFESMGADLSRVFVRTEIEDEDGRRPLVLPGDGDLLGNLADELRPALLIVDPLVDIEDPKLDTHKQAALRAVFAPLRRTATGLGCAVVVVRHTRKSAADAPTQRIIGSIDAVAAARVVWMVGMDPQKPERRGLAVAKTNLGARPEPRAFTIAANGSFGWERDAAPELTPEALAGPSASSEDRTALGEAEDFLRAMLADGPAEARQVQRDARDAALSWRTVERAKASLGIASRREDGRWIWALPATRPPAALHGGDGGLGGLGGLTSPTPQDRRASPPLADLDQDHIYQDFQRKAVRPPSPVQDGPSPQRPRPVSSLPLPPEEVQP